MEKQKTKISTKINIKESLNETKSENKIKGSFSLRSLWFRFKYFFLWFIGLFGFFSMNTHCPCCGQNVCPAGAGVLVLLSGVFALFIQFGRSILAYIRKIFLKIFKIFKF
jgi:hypothetical protein